MLPKNFPYRHKLHVKEATERKALSDSLTAEQRLQVLDSRLGKGIGAVRERLRLSSLLKTEESILEQTPIKNKRNKK